MDTAMNVIGSLMIVLGALVFLGAALGLVRFPDPYTRISATGTAGGVGMILLVVGALLHMPSVANVVKVVLIVVLQLGSASVATMALARSAYLTGVPMNPGHYDELAEDTPGREHGEPAPHAPDEV
ncbi:MULTISPECIES: monovalent cation/H(+) antiporter subunit G [Actinomycetes]|uniref:Multicomponent Na+:H+ antiporter subunit G n=1 Tax=Micrococcus aloeverae TaxID=1391911 RepID=A0ABR6DZU6_9MICC|nr:MULTISPECIES: monovalent cation/H(+) antiporter subunit G [Micrococcus]EZP40258.1 putative monovalent cation/H+ antiporter subunit G [Micrococcus luteus]KYK00600.1 cation:proton antiporter [Micrococcus sp. CH3]KYK07142.1 cation:proton antiporter [Micrococcus sp. CH7]MBA9081684.1 multicomponent Na+:H+ antiporter subunit G [Micrococcus aloeverae]MCK6056968.1 monovalent cation/H(+) antiporter subunit G [Micrococcus luteus]